MKKLLAKIIGATTALAMAIGVGLAVGNNRKAIMLDADSDFQATMSYSGSTTNMSASGNAARVGLNGTIFTVNSTKQGNNFPGLNTDGTIRLYAGSDGSISVSVTSSYIVDDIVITYSSSSYNGADVYVNGDNVEGTTNFTINHTSFVIKNGRESGQVRMTSVVINYSNASGGTPAPTLDSVTLSGNLTKSSYTTAENWDPAGLVVTGNYSDNSHDDLTAYAAFAYYSDSSMISSVATPNDLGVGNNQTIYVKATVSEVSNLSGYLQTVSVTAPITYSVSYNANGGTGTMTDNTSYISGAQVTIQANTFTKSGYCFSGFNTESNGSGLSYVSGAKFNITGDTTLYAQWSEKPASIDNTVTDTITQTEVTKAGNSYASFSANGSSGATYVGYSLRPEAPNSGCIQFNNFSSSKNRSIATSVSGGFIRRVIVEWGNAESRHFTVYVGNSAYSNSSTGASGTSKGTIDTTTTYLDILDGDYKYVSVYPNGAVYPLSISFVWEPLDQTLTSVGSAYANQSITVSSDATSAVTWSIVEDGNTTASHPSITQAGVVSVQGAGTVKVKAVAVGFKDATTILTFNEVPAAEVYEVTFDSDGGSETIYPINKEEGQTFTFPSPGTKTHYSFYGWSSDGDTFYDPGDTSPAVVADIEYIGFWIKDTTYVVTYCSDSNGSGSFADDGDNFEGEYTLLPFNSLTGVSASEGYRFVDYTVGGVHKDPGDTFTLGATTEVTVNFEKIPLEFIVSFGTNEASGILSNFSNTSFVIPSGVTLDNIQGNLYSNNENQAAAIRFGKGGTTGSFDVTISYRYYITKIVANLKYYGSDTTAQFAVTPDGGDAIETTMRSGYANYRFDVSSSLTNKVTLGTTIDGKRAFLSGFSVEYDERIKTISTQKSLAYSDYNDEGDGTFTYTNLGIRFGGVVNADLYDSMNIQSYGVFLSTAEFIGSDSIEDYYNVSKTSENTIDQAITEMCQGNYIRNFSSNNTRHDPAEKANPTQVGDDYVWMLYNRIPVDALTTTYVAVAYVRTTDKIIFLQEVSASAKSLAYNMINVSHEYESDAFGGSLNYLATRP